MYSILIQKKPPIKTVDIRSKYMILLCTVFTFKYKYKPGVQYLCKSLKETEALAVILSSKNLKA